MDEEHKHDAESHEENDQMDVRFPIGGGFMISGPNAASLWGKIGWIGIVIASGWAMERVIRAFMEK